MEKDNFFTGIGIALLTFFSPAYGLFALITVACLVDHLFGVWRVLKLKEHFRFLGGLAKTFSKVVAYLLIIGIAYVFDRNLMNEVSVKFLSVSDVVAKVFTLGLCLNEWKSINRNFKAVKGVSMWEQLMEGLTGVRKVVEKAAEIKNKLPMLLCLFVLSCSPIYRHDRLVTKYPYLHRPDTIEQSMNVPVDIPGVRVDTVFKDVVRPDTLRIVKERLTIQYLKRGDTVYLSGKCDPIKEYVKVKVKVPVKYFPEPLKWWQFPAVIFGFAATSLGIGWYLSKRK